MCADDDMALIERMSALAIQAEFIEFAAIVQRGDFKATLNFYNSMELRVAQKLFHFWIDTAACRQRPDLIVSIALRVRDLIRANMGTSPQQTRAA